MRLEALTPDGFDRWHTAVQQRFADLRARTGTMTATDAAARAAGILARLLPDGLATPQHHIQQLLDADEVVGQLWLQVDDVAAETTGNDAGSTESTGTDAFLYDIHLTPGALARGLGTAAMDLTEQAARGLGAAVLRVNVFTDDAATRALVAGRGFEPAAIQMVLRLDGLAPAPAEGAAGEPDAVEPDPRGQGTVELRAMTPVQFESFCATQVAGYAADLERSGTASGIRARQKADADFAELLPDGLRSPGQLFWTAYEGAEDIGWLWLQVETGPDGARAFVLDIEVRPEFRRRGHARSIMRGAEREARSRGAVTIGLSVFGYNDGARALYDSLGYQPVEVLQRKVL